MAEPAGTPASSSGPAQQYAAHGFVHLRRLVPSELGVFLARYLLLLHRTGQLRVEEQQVPGSSSAYGDPAFDTLLEVIGPSLGAVVGSDLVPTYSYARIYEQGQELTPHRDRPACQHSLSVFLAGEGGSWPLHLARPEGRAVALTLDPGDAVLYQGCDLVHWRTPLAGTWHAQAFLHYVAADGPHAAERFDGRPDLGLPASSKAGRGQEAPTQT